MKNIATLLRASVIAFLCVPLLAQAQAKARDEPKAGEAKVGERFGAWVFECVALAEGKTACALTQTIVSAKDNRRILQLSLGRNAKSGAVMLTAFLPLGIHLPSGASGAIDQGKPFQYTLETCLPQRCIATYAVPAGFLRTLQSGKQLDVTFGVGNPPQPVTVGAALNGLAEGLRAARLE